MKRKGWVWGILGILLFALSVWQINQASQGLVITKLPSKNTTVTRIHPDIPEVDTRPIVLIGHGLAGSGVIMRSFAFTLAHAGYDTLLWDFAGHGANPNPLRSEYLLADAEAALKALKSQRSIPDGWIAILGHSMGSGVALDYGIEYPGTNGTVAVSPVYRQVTDKLPKNLLLMAGANEPRFLANAQDILFDAGGENTATALGRGRKLVVIPLVEHVSILFAPAAHQASRQWLDGIFGEQPDSRSYKDARIGWYLAAICGSLITLIAFSPFSTRTTRTIPTKLPLLRRIAALVAGVAGATLVFWIGDLVNVNLNEIFGISVGGALLLWLAISGLIALSLLNFKIDRPSKQEIAASGVVFAVLWISVGLLGQMVWLQWVLIPERLTVWLIGIVMILPWFLAISESSLPARKPQWVIWWLLDCILVVGGLLILLRLLPEYSFLLLLLPIVPAIIGLHSLATLPYRQRWSFTLSGAFFLSWVIAAIFPLI
jgi:pimeloyl-ACP methyl ester carboxylesterase